MTTVILDTQEPLETMVNSYQKGNEQQFEQIYCRMATVRRMSYTRLRQSLPSVITDSDINAMIDDALLTSCNCYSLDGTASFITYYNAVLNNNRLSALTHVSRLKRDFTVKLLSQIITEDSEPVEVTDLLEDGQSVKQFEAVEGSELVDQLKGWAQISNRNELNALLIAWDCCSHWQTASSKYSYMKMMTGLTVNDSTLRKRIYRAKADFKLWLQAKDGDCL